MKKHRGMISLGVVLYLFLLFPITASANSSWHWISSKKPYELLLFIAPLTIAAEFAAINYIPQICKPKKVLLVVGAANLASFLAPYLLLLLDDMLLDNIPRETTVLTIEQICDNIPYYTVGVVFLIMTICVELPIVYFTLRNDCEKKRRLLLTIIGANVVTTGLCALAERLLCYGKW